MSASTDSSPTDTDATAKDEKHRERPERAVTHRAATEIGGRSLAYRTTAATITLRDDKGKPRASLFTVSHVLEGVDDPTTRPVTFCFNGGPGSSSVWLNYGAFGPKRVDMPDAQVAPPPPYRVVDNAHGLLDLTDMVFIDPVGTGFSRAQGDADAKDFHTIDGDIDSVGQLIRRWLDENGRWASPKLLAGESYGTTRAAGLAGWLSDNGVILNGLILVSLAADFQTFLFEPGNDLPNVLYLPAYAATAWYHDRLAHKPADLHAYLDEVREFATEVYAPALLAGARLPEDRLETISQQLAAITGLPADQIKRRRLRIEYTWFLRTLLGDGDDTVGRLDSRYVGPDSDPYGQQMSRDPSYDSALGAFTASVNDHLRRTLGWEDDEPYAILSRAVNQGWSWVREDRMGYPNTTADLRRALLANPHLQVLFCNGLYDLATPFFAAEYTADHLLLPDRLRDNVQLTWYPAGHMMYFHPPSLVQLKADISALFERAISSPARTD